MKQTMVLFKVLSRIHDKMKLSKMEGLLAIENQAFANYSICKDETSTVSFPNQSTGDHCSGGDLMLEHL